MTTEMLKKGYLLFPKALFEEQMNMKTGEKGNEEAQKLIAKAQEEAKRIIEDAHKEADSIVATAHK